MASASGKGRTRDPLTGRFIRADIVEKLEALATAQGETEEGKRPEDLVEGIEELAEHAEEKMEQYEKDIESLNRKIRILELDIKVSAIAQQNSEQTVKDQSTSLDQEIDQLRLLKSREVLIDATKLDIKLPPPEEYDGTPGKLRPFLTQCELVFQGKTDQYQSGKSRVLYAISFFNKGEALAWKQMIVQTQTEFLKDLAKQAADNDTGLWESAKAVFERLFCPQSSKLESQQKLLHIKQGTRTIEQYTTAFKLIGVDADLDKDMSLILWKQGLKPVIKQKIYESGDIPTKFDQWVERAKAIDLGWREYQTERGNSFKEGRNRRTFEPKDNNRPRLSDEEYQKRRKEGLCYKCGNKGHLANKCFAKVRKIEEDSTQETQEDF